MLRGVRESLYAGFFRNFPALAAATREYRQGATKSHPSSFGLNLFGPEYLINSSFEQEEISLVKEHLSAVDTFVDIGANIGIYTCLAASMGKHVVAVEPLPSNLRSLYQNIKTNGLSGIEVFPIGLSSSPGIFTLRGIGAQASFLRGWASEDYGFNQQIATDCPTNTLDALVGSRFPGQRLFVKVDVEGFEHEVLKGATSTLDRLPAPAWMVECILDQFHPGGNPNFIDTFHLFFDRGYHARSPDGTAVTHSMIAEWAGRGRAGPGIGFNFFFSKSQPMNN